MKVGQLGLVASSGAIISITMVRNSASARHTVKFKPKRLVLLGVFLLVLYVVLPQIKAFHSSLQAVHHAQFGWLGVGFVLVLGTYAAAAGVYGALAVRPLRYPRSVLVQLAGTFANRLLPAGIGAIGVNYRYLRRNSHTPAQAGAVVAVNNMLGAVGHGLLFFAIIVCTSTSLRGNVFGHGVHIGRAVFIGAGMAVLVVVALAIFRRQQLHEAILSIVEAIKSYRRRPLRLTFALLISMMLTSLYGLCLLACARAIGLEPGIAKLFIVLTLGVAGSTVVPTPGGLGGAEAGLIVGLVAYGISGADALAVVLLYRLLTYWLPLFFGGAALIIVERRKII